MEGEWASEEDLSLWIMSCAMGVFYQGFLSILFEDYVSACTEGMGCFTKCMTCNLCYNDDRRLAIVTGSSVDHSFPKLRHSLRARIDRHQ